MIQYFNKKQQQSLLEFIENGSITLIASTTENPYFYVYNAVLSRSTVFEFKAISARDVEGAVRRAVRLLSEREGVEADCPDEVVALVAQGCGGVASDELCRLVVLNTASIQLLPTTVASIRAVCGSAAPLDILPAVWVSSLLSVTAGLVAAKLLERLGRRRT